LRRILDTGSPLLELELTGETPAQPGAQRTWLNSWLPVRDRGGTVIGISVVAEETTRRRHMENELKNYRERLEEMVKERTRQVEEMNEALDRTNRKLGESEELFRGVFEKSPIGIAITDSVTQRFLRANRRFCELTGYTADELAGMTIESITHPEDRQRESDYIRDYHQNPLTPFHMEKRYVRKNGEVRLVSLTGDFIDMPGGAPPLALGNVIDITEHRRAEEKISSLLAEKELLLKEVHHRIKNNFNTVMNLLALQSRGQSNPAVSATLMDAQSRIKSMEALYDKLYRSESFKEVSIRNYLPLLMDEIVAMFPHRDMVTLETETADFQLSAKLLSPLGIIVSELVTNSMKYAFMGRDRGLIQASASLKDGRVTLIYKDNGNGIHESIGFDGSTGFGLQLIALLTKQLKGTIRLERHQGAMFILEFPA
jgi:PAS domain S-box-containing protein